MDCNNGVTKLKSSLHEQFLCDKFYLFASLSHVYTSNFYLKTKDWRLGSTDDVKTIANFMCCLVYTNNFLHVTNALVFSAYIIAI